MGGQGSPGQAMQAIEKKSVIGKFRRPIREILEDFETPIPGRFIKQKPTYNKDDKGKYIKNGTVPYVPWINYIKLLNWFCPGFDWEIRVKEINRKTVVEGRLTIRAEEGDFVQEATGQEEANCSKFGDPTSNAESMALRRCCAKFGLGLHLWEK